VFTNTVDSVQKKDSFSSGVVLLLREYSQGGQCMAAHRGGRQQQRDKEGKTVTRQPQTAHGTQLSSLFIYLLKQFEPQPRFV
jgi:hypothetical protein